MGEKENQFSLKSIGSERPKDSFSLKQVSATSTAPKVEPDIERRPSFGKPEQPKPAQTDFAATPKQSSFLKSETAPDSVEISILTKDVVRPARRPKGGEPKSLKLLAAVGVILVLLLGGAFSWFVFNKGPFYTGSWMGELSEAEKSKGVKELSYQINKDSFIEKLSTDTEGLSVTAKVSAKIEIVENKNNVLAFKKKDRKIEDINVNIPSILCQKTGTNCDQLRTNFEKTFREEIEKQNKSMENATFKLTAKQSNQLKLESDVEAARNLNKTK